MTSIALAQTGRKARLVVSIEALRLWALWLFLAVSAFAAIEPSPYEFMFFVVLIAFAGGGLRFDKAMIPLILTLFVYDAGGLLALAPFTDQSESVNFIGISVYISLTAIFFAAAVALAPTQRMAAIRSGYIMAGMIAAALGILGYFSERWVPNMGSVKFGDFAGGTAKDVGISLFTDYLLPFEVTSVLILIAILGAVVLASKEMD